MNLVLDNVDEVTRGMLEIFSYSYGVLRPSHLRICSKRNTNISLSSDEEGNTSTRSLGLLVARGTLLVLISPVDGSEEIENPFVQGEDEE